MKFFKNVEIKVIETKDAKKTEFYSRLLSVFFYSLIDKSLKFLKNGIMEIRFNQNFDIRNTPKLERTSFIILFSFLFPALV